MKQHHISPRPAAITREKRRTFSRENALTWAGGAASKHWGGAGCVTGRAEPASLGRRATSHICSVATTTTTTTTWIRRNPPHTHTHSPDELHAHSTTDRRCILSGSWSIKMMLLFAFAKDEDVKSDEPFKPEMPLNSCPKNRLKTIVIKSLAKLEYKWRV